jgi:hypothetical protein
VVQTIFLLLLSALLALPAAAQSSPSKVKAKVKTTKAQTTKQKVAVKKAPTKKAPAKPAVAAAPLLTFQRSVCMGPCPAYVVRLFADGRVAYEGQLNVPVLGRKEFKLTPSNLKELLRIAEEARFAQLKDEYAAGVTDVPSTIVALRQADGQLKTVVVESGAPIPDQLQDLVSYLRNQFDPLAGLDAGH